MAVKYEFTEHLVEQQFKAEEAMLKELEAGNYTLSNPLVKYNLYLVNPLSAVIAFKTEKEIAITVTVLGKTPEANIRHTFPKAKTHVLPIVGLYSDYANKVEIRAYRSESNVVTIDVPDVFNGTNPIISMDTTPEYLQDNIIIVSPSGEFLAVGYDYAGDARWHMNVACIFDIKRLRNGNLIMGSHRLIGLPYYMSGLYEISPCGKVYKEYRVPGGYHHDEWEMPDGNLLCLTEDLESPTVEDMCVLLDRNTGEIIKTWDYKKFLKPGLGKSGSWSDHDWFHNNAVWYDVNTNSLTFSGRHMDSIVNIDFESGDLNWIISDPTGWPQEWVDKYFFKPIGNNFGWQYEQHACLITPNGDVMCFDNHHYGSKTKETYLPAKDNYSRGVRYKINTDDMTIEQVWEYGTDRGADFFSPYICNVEFYNEGHYMVHSGGIAYDKDGNPSEALGAFVTTQGGTQKSITVEIADGVKQLELQCKSNFYRAEKLKLYSDGINLELGKGKILGENGHTREADADPTEAMGITTTSGMIPDSCKAELHDEFDKFTFKSTFEKGQLVVLYLEQGSEKHKYFISTTAVSFLAMCVGTFMDTDERNTRTFVSKKGLKGTYDVKIFIDDKLYETGVKVTC